MPIPVPLSEVADGLDSLTYETTAFLSSKSGKLLLFTMEELSAAEEERPLDGLPEWQREQILEAAEVIYSEDYVALPSKFDLNDYNIMRDFCYSIEDDDAKDQFLYAISGSGAFRRFRDLLHRSDLQDTWYRFRGKALEEIAIEWLEEIGVPYTRQ